MAAEVSQTNAAPVRLPALPTPPPLQHVSEEQKKRIKDVEKQLRLHETSATLSDAEFRELSLELDDLRGFIAEVPQGEQVGDEPPGADAEDDDQALPKRSGSRKLEIKREIRDIEKAIKGNKKKPPLPSREIADLTARLQKLKGELTSCQAVRKRVVMSLQLRGRGGGAPDGGGEAATLASEDRISLAGLSEEQGSLLRDCFEQQAGSAPGSAAWSLWRHPGLRTAALRGRSAEALAEELRGVAELAPHVVCVGTASLRSRGGICAVLRDFRGALVLLEEPGDDAPGDTPAQRGAEAACVLGALRVKSRWQARAGTCELEAAELPRPPEGEVIGDLKWRDVKESSELSPLLADAEAECRREFDEDLESVLASDSIRMGLLVSTPTSRGKGAPQRDFLGFITYKFWGPPLKAMSVSRIAVPKRYQMQGFGRQLVRWAIDKAKQKLRYDCDRVTLSAIPKAVTFYERLNFTPVADEEGPADDADDADADAAAGDDDEDGPRAADSVKMEYRLGRK